MKKISGVFATTDIDSQGEQLSREALDGMAAHLSTSYLPMHTQHDPRVVPIGRIVGGRVEERGAGRFVLLGEMEIWEDGDTFDDLEGDGRQIRIEPQLGLEVCLDRGLLDNSEAVAELEAALGSAGDVRYRAKKAADLGMTILVSVGVFTLGQIAAGVLNQLGSDAYNKLKSVLAKWTTAQKPPAAIEVLLTIDANNRLVEVHCFLPNPTAEDVLSFFTIGLMSVPNVVASTISENPRAVRIFIQWLGGKWQTHYWLRDDGVPSRIEAFPIDRLEGMGLSLSGSVRIEDIRQ